MRPYLALGLLGAVGALAAEPLHFASGSGRVTLVELYTSEGCSSFPPADHWLGALRGDPGLWREFVPVEFHVNYWDRLGWKDRLSTRQFTEREYAYASAWGSQNVYTPCFVRNGTEWRPSWGGGRPAGGPAGELSVDLGADGVCRAEFRPVGGIPAARGDYVVHVALLGGGLTSKVSAGENDGSTLEHEFVVLSLAAKPLAAPVPGKPLQANLTLPDPTVADARRHALAAWVTRPGDPAPIQATGGWLP